MQKTTTRPVVQPEVDTTGSETVRFPGGSDSRGVLDELVLRGAQRMLQASIEAEVDEFLASHGDRRDGAGNRQVVRNGYLPPREIVTGAGALEIQQPRARDKSPVAEERVRFEPRIVPAYLRRSHSTRNSCPGCTSRGFRRATSRRR